MKPKMSANKNSHKQERDTVAMCSICLCEQRLDPRTAISLKTVVTSKQNTIDNAFAATCPNSINQHNTNTINFKTPTTHTSNIANTKKNFNNNNTNTNNSNTDEHCICHLNATTNLTKLNRNTHKIYTNSKQHKTKFYLSFIIFICAIQIQTSYAIPVKASGKHLILHTNEYRQRYHPKLMQQQRTDIPTTITHHHHHHHLHHRSSGNMPDQQNLDCINLKHFNNARDQMDFAHNRTLGTLNSNLLPYRYDKTSTEMKNEWSEHKLNLSHPHMEFDHNNITLPRNMNELKKQINLMLLHLSKLEHVYKDFNNDFNNGNSTHDNAYDLIKKHHDETYASIKAMINDLNMAYNDGEEGYAAPKFMGTIENVKDTKVLDYKLSEHFLEILEIYKKIFDHFLCPKTKLH